MWSAALVVGSSLSVLVTVIIIIIINSLIINDIFFLVQLPSPIAGTLGLPSNNLKNMNISICIFVQKKFPLSFECREGETLSGSWRYWWILYKMTPEVIRNKYKYVPLFEDQFRSQSVKITDKIVFIRGTGPCLVSEFQRRYS